LLSVAAILLIVSYLYPLSHAQFLPTKEKAPDWRAFNGIVGVVEPILTFFKNDVHRPYAWRPIRVLPIGVGCLGNMLYLLDIASLHTISTQGNRFLEAEIDKPVTAEHVGTLAENFGFDYLWIGPKENAWMDSIRASGLFKQRLDNPFVGTVFEFSAKQKKSYLANHEACWLSWFEGDDQISVKNTWWQKVWTFHLQAPPGQTGIRLFHLPLMWLQLYEARDDRLTPLKFKHDETGRMLVMIGDQSRGTTQIIVKYPRDAVKTLFQAGVFVYALMLLILLGLLIWMLLDRLLRKKPSAA
jgi:hypothetical protein